MGKKLTRSSGVLLHVTSLPGRYGIGSLGSEARDFTDFLVKSGQKLWQICPLGPTGFGDSPYQTYSAFAGNPLLIDLENLKKRRLIGNTELKSVPDFNENYVDYEGVAAYKEKVLRSAYTRFKKKIPQKFFSFINDNAHWLEDYSIFMALKKDNDGKPWMEWDDSLRLRHSAALLQAKKNLADEIQYQQFLQYIFFQQWHKLKKYVNDNGIEIIGDIPIYPALDSADVWANTHYFQFDENLQPLAVAGCPPDEFSLTGQLWGNPLYNWDKLAANNFDWWIKRFAETLKIVDYVRLDHFLGFENYWSVPYGSPTAENGSWQPGPSHALFDALIKELGELPIIAEDLGVITPQVEKLRDDYNFPGMKILHFAFDGEDTNPYLPHNFPENCVVYTGTHDNETTVGWYQNLPQHIKNNIRTYLSYLKFTDWEVGWKMIEAALDSRAAFAIAPLQDYIGLDNKARFNLPGTVGNNNWRWRFSSHDLTDERAEGILRMVKKAKR